MRPMSFSLRFAAATAALAMPFIGCATSGSRTVPDDLLTVAERSGFTATATHAEVLALLDRLADLHPQRARRASFGTSVEGRELPLLIVADPPCASAEEARSTGRMVALLLADIHAGEVCGKEALPVLAREILADPDAPGNAALLKQFVLLFAPVYNADGNDRMALDNRPEQDGPARGMGQRRTAADLDLNRDYMKLEARESRALAALFDAWNPDLTIDCHTTDGSFHRYALTYDCPLNPACHPAPVRFIRDAVLPEVTRRVLAKTGWHMFFYGNFDDARTRWETYEHLPRYGDSYRGLRGRMAILSEAYSHADYRTRVLATLEFVRACLTVVAERADEARDVLARAERETIAAARGATRDAVPIRARMAAYPEPITILGVVEEQDEHGNARPTDRPRDVKVTHFGRFEPTLSVPRPAAYLVPAACAALAENLALHGIRIERVDAAREANVEAFTIGSIERAPRTFEHHDCVRLEGTFTAGRRSIPAGTLRVPLDQPLGTLAVYLLEPQSDDGLTTWNFLDPWLAPGAEFPILREVR